MDLLLKWKMPTEQTLSRERKSRVSRAHVGSIIYTNNLNVQDPLTEEIRLGKIK